ncbi:MAG TPA: tetratricopeptide repeat protein, partial [Candidatus Rifleibacterium sp.]|nr:tetratricopeptide repeat protein [Candidatus Rifleibacterium sp.]
MDGIKLPIFLLLIVLALGVFLFNPFSGKQTPGKTRPAKTPGTTSGSAEQAGSANSAAAVKAARQPFEKSNYEEVVKILSPFRDVADFDLQRMLAYSFAGLKFFDAAIIAFEKTLESRKIPENAYSLAYLYEITGRINVARILYEQLISAELPTKMRRAVYEGLARTSTYENDLKLALKYNTELVKNYPDSPEGVVALIKLLRTAGQLKGLENLVNLGEKYHSRNFDYNFWLGALYYDSGRFDDSMKHFKRCIEIDPNNSTPYFYTYNILKKQKNIEQALADLEKYHRLNPLLPQIFFEASIDAKKENRLDLAYKFFRSAVTMDRTLLGRDDKGTMNAVERMIKANGSALDKTFLTAFINFINGDYKISREQITHLTPELKGSAYEDDGRRIIRECDILAMQDARYASHVASLQQQRQLENMARLETVVSTPGLDADTPADQLKRQAMQNPNDLRLQYTAGLELAKLGHLDAARIFFGNAIRLNPNLVEPNYSMAKVLIFEESFADARAYLDQALKVNPNNSQTLSLSALLHMQNRDFLRAQSDAEGALKANPNNGEARLVLAEVFARNSD